MIWRRVLVPETYTPRELHGVFQIAMGGGWALAEQIGWKCSNDFTLL